MGEYDEELNQIAAYLVSLGGEGHPQIEPTAEERIHLQAALEALEQDDTASAQNHIQLATDLASGENLETYQELMQMLADRDAAKLEHELEELLEE